MSLVVVVDDRTTNRHILCRLARSLEAGTETKAFDRPLTALAAMKDRPPDLIITDFAMPEMDGAEFVARCRRELPDPDLPIIVITAYEDQDFRYRALEAGATDFLLSPIDHREFRTRAGNLLKMGRQQRIIRQRTNLLEKELGQFHPPSAAAAQAPGEGEVRTLAALPARQGHNGKCYLAVNGWDSSAMDLAGRQEMADLDPETCLAQRELATARAEAAQADAAKSRFLAAASHDLRQPFQAMNLYMQLLEELELPPKARTIADLLRKSVQAGEELLSALLDISALEAGTVTPNITVFAVADLVQELIGEYSSLAAGKGLSLRAFPVEALVETDRVLAKRMIRNLVHNAFRYTERGGILVGCRRRGSRILIQVFDTACGIPPDKLQMIFEDFYQLDNPSRDKAKGLGLGLSIVERTAHLLGQDVWVASRLGRGSVFSITLPLAGDRKTSPPKGGMPT